MPWMAKPYFYSSDIRGLHRAKLSPFQKKFYAKLYRLRIVEQKRFVVGGAKYTEDLKRFHRLQDEYLLLVNNDIKSVVDLVDFIGEQEEKIQQIEDRQHEIYRESSSRKRSIKNEEQYREYQIWHVEVQEELDELKQEKREIKRQIQLADDIIKEDLYTVYYAVSGNEEIVADRDVEIPGMEENTEVETGAAAVVKPDANVEVMNLNNNQNEIGRQKEQTDSARKQQTGLEGIRIPEVHNSSCPGYITDALYRVENLDRYDDRLQVTTNLIEAYYLLMEFVAKHTSDKFCLINNISTSIRGIISREVIGNILVHRDYSSAYPAKVIIEKDWLRTENWCIPRRHGNIMSDEFTPYPKNPLIQQFFANIGRTDTIGSGVRNLYKYTPMYSDGGKPELIEDDVFRINIPLDRIAADEATEQKTLSEREQKIYNMICENLHLSVEQVMAELDISRSTVFRDYAKIKKVTGAVYDKKTSTWTL